MKKFLKWAGFVLALYVAQTSLLPRLAFHGASADLLLLFTVSFGFLRGQRLGVLVGFLAGLLEDLTSGTFFGMNIFTKMLAGLVSGMLSDRVFKEHMLLPVVSSVVAAVLNYFILAVLMLLLGYRFNLLANAEYVLLPIMLYQLAFSYPVHRLTRRVNSWAQEKREGSHRFV